MSGLLPMCAQMNNDLFTEKLNWFKQNERPEVVLLVAVNPDRIQIVVAWTSLNVRCAEKLTGLRSESESDVWEWLWKNARYSKAELIDKIGISFSESALETKMRPLIANRILYPDGSINSFVQRYLREQILKLFETKPKGPAPAV